MTPAETIARLEAVREWLDNKVPYCSMPVTFQMELDKHIAAIESALAALRDSENQRTQVGPIPNTATSEVRPASPESMADENAEAVGQGSRKAGAFDSHPDRPMPEKMADLFDAANRVYKKYGSESDWTEWTDLRDALRELEDQRASAATSRSGDSGLTGSVQSEVHQSALSALDRVWTNRNDISAFTLAEAWCGWWPTVRKSLVAHQSEREKAAREAAEVCKKISADAWHEFKTSPQSNVRANPYTEGQSDGADSCESAILKHFNLEAK